MINAEAKIEMNVPFSYSIWVGALAWTTHKIWKGIYNYYRHLLSKFPELKGGENDGLIQDVSTSLLG